MVGSDLYLPIDARLDYGFGAARRDHRSEIEIGVDGKIEI
jgi:hypothetical protein